MEQREDGKLMWNINVRACRREDVHAVRQWLRESGLELARLWFEHEAHLWGKSFWRAFFDEDLREFDVQHN